MKKIFIGLILLVFCLNAFGIDSAANFSKSTLAAGISSSDLSLSVQTGHGTRFPTPPFNAVVWNQTDYPDPSDAYWTNECEIVRVTAILSDAFTITRAQEGTTARNFNTAGKTYGIIYTITAQFFTDVSTLVPSFVVLGPGVATTTDRITLFSDTSGTNIYESVVGIDSSGNITGVNNLTMSGTLTTEGLNVDTLIVTNGISTVTNNVNELYITNKVTLTGSFLMKSNSAPAGVANYGQFYFKTNGSGKMEFLIQFPTGAAQIVATEP